MKRILTYQVYPSIPEPLAFLEVLSRNLWWCWKQDAVTLFRRVDPELWKESGGNPIHLLSNVRQARLEELAVDDSFLAHLQRIKDRFTKRVSENVEADRDVYEKMGPVAYFSMEFGIHESIPIFAGGLGVLAGDYLKAASNMALPIVGVGLLYRKGYFRQYLDREGLQQEEYPEIEFYYLPLERARDPQGNEITISITGPEGEIHAFVWRVWVGRTPLFLLDTNLPENTPEAREITARLYVAEPKIRLAQEVLLGVGGMRALTAMGIFPSICHMNEGHSAFCAMERLALFRENYHIDLKTALQIVPRCTVFTTHTPVAAGHDSFPADLVKPWIQPLQNRLGAGEHGVSRSGSLSMRVIGRDDWWRLCCHRTLGSEARQRRPAEVGNRPRQNPGGGGGPDQRGRLRDCRRPRRHFRAIRHVQIVRRFAETVVGEFEQDQIVLRDSKQVA